MKMLQSVKESLTIILILGFFFVLGVGSAKHLTTIPDLVLGFLLWNILPLMLFWITQGTKRWPLTLKLVTYLAAYIPPVTGMIIGCIWV